MNAKDVIIISEFSLVFLLISLFIVSIYAVIAYSAYHHIVTAAGSGLVASALVDDIKRLKRCE